MSRRQSPQPLWPFGAWVEHAPPEEDGNLHPLDGDELLRPQAEEELAGIGHRGPLSGRGQGSMLKHLVWTYGPVHRAFPFMLQLRVEVEGERVVSVDPEVGWHHQGLEKQFETTPWRQCVSLMELLHPRAPHGHQLAMARAIEVLCGIEDKVPPLAQHWRVILAELARILDHLQVFYEVLLAHPKRQAHRAVMDAALEVRALLALAGETEDGRPQIGVGGLSALPREEMVSSLPNRLHTCLDGARRVLAEYLRDRTFVDQLLGLGTITPQHAAAFGITGPALRATGVEDDVRVTENYFAYRTFPPSVATQSGGDALARLAVRAAELEASMALVDVIQSAIAHDADRRRAPVAVDSKDLPTQDDQLLIPPGRVALSAEVAGGELNVLAISDGGAHPARIHLRPPSFALASALPLFLTGATLDDLASIIQGLGMSGTEIDR